MRCLKLADTFKDSKKREYRWVTEKQIMETERERESGSIRERSLKVVVRADKCQASMLTSEVPAACLVCLSACIDSLLH